jgi:DNA-binding MarR family transcriptional regulator
MRRKPRRGKTRTAPDAGLGPRLPAPGEGKRGMGGHLGYLLRQASAAHRLRLERALAPLGATVPQFLILTMVAAYPGASGAALARLALLTPQTVGTILDNLRRAGLVVRRRHPAHGRIVTIAPTARGLARLAACRRRADAAERRLADELGPAAERALRRWLVAVATG